MSRDKPIELRLAPILARFQEMLVRLAAARADREGRNDAR